MLQFCIAKDNTTPQGLSYDVLIFTVPFYFACNGNRDHAALESPPARSISIMTAFLLYVNNVFLTYVLICNNDRVAEKKLSPPAQPVGLLLLNIKLDFMILNADMDPLHRRFKAVNNGFGNGIFQFLLDGTAEVSCTVGHGIGLFR